MGTSIDVTIRGGKSTAIREIYQKNPGWSPVLIQKEYERLYQGQTVALNTIYAALDSIKKTAEKGGVVEEEFERAQRPLGVEVVAPVGEAAVSGEGIEEIRAVWMWSQMKDIRPGEVLEVLAIVPDAGKLVEILKFLSEVEGKS